MNVLADQVIGLAEGSPVAVVVTHTTGRTAAVGAEFAGGGRDVMRPVDRWAVLVHKLTAGKSAFPAEQYPGTAIGQATVFALSTRGKVLERAYLPGSGALALAAGACAVSGGGVGTGSGAGAGTSPGGAGSSSGATGSSVAPAGTQLVPTTSAGG